MPSKNAKRHNDCGCAQTHSEHETFLASRWRRRGAIKLLGQQGRLADNVPVHRVEKMLTNLILHRRSVGSLDSNGSAWFQHKRQLFGKSQIVWGWKPPNCIDGTEVA